MMDTRGPIRRLLLRRTPPVRCGYTLLELMVVMAILAALSVMAWPRMASRMRRITPREGALQLNAELAEMREAAIRSGEAWAVRIEPGKGHYEIGPVAAFRSRQLDRDRLSGVAAGSSLASRSNELPLPAGGAGPAALDHRGADRKQAPPVTASVSGDHERPDITKSSLPGDLIFTASHDLSSSLATRTPSPHMMLPPTAMSPTAMSPQGPAAIARDSGTDRHQGPEQARSPQAPGATDAGWNRREPLDRGTYVVIFQPDGRATDAALALKDLVTGYLVRLRVRGLTGAVSIDPVESPAPPVNDAGHLSGQQAEQVPVSERPALRPGEALQPATSHE